MDSRIKKITDENPGRFTDVGNEVSYGCFSATTKLSCGNTNDDGRTICVGTLTVKGHFGIGEELLSGYTPEPGELVKNDHMKCDTCDFEQFS
jgi:hypothetical protein